MKILALLLVAAFAAAWCPAPARAAVNVERTGAENPMVEVARSTLYGGLAGLMLGGAIALVDDSHDDAKVLKWGFAGGTFLGFGVGLISVLRRPEPTGLLQLENGRAHLALSPPRPTSSGTLALDVVSVRF
jgi:F0F1-type ATP synthase assembly protein I